MALLIYNEKVCGNRNSNIMLCITILSLHIKILNYIVNYKYDKESWYVLKAYVVVYESNLTMKLFDKNEGLIKP